MSAGKKFRTALENNKPLQIVGTINAYSAIMAKKIGHQAIYLSGGGVANASYGLPDLGMTSLNDVLVDVQRITSACDLPLLVDIDTGWGGAFNIAKTIRDMEKAGAAAVHMEDQVAQNDVVIVLIRKLSLPKKWSTVLPQQLMLVPTLIFSSWREPMLLLRKV